MDDEKLSDNLLMMKKALKAEVEKGCRFSSLEFRTEKRRDNLDGCENVILKD